jgi:hypothetical protein
MTFAFHLVSDWLAAHSAAVQAAAAIAGVVLTATLVATTILYLRATNRILLESRKSREAAERQASAAQRSVDLLQRQFAEQLGLGRAIVQSAVESALSAISYWNQRPLTKAAAGPGFPPPDNLIPANADAAVEHARRISPEAAQELSSAFDDLRNAVSEIERIRLISSATRGMGYLETTPSAAPVFLREASVKLQSVKARLP